VPRKSPANGGPGGEDVWESYIENKTRGARRIWWLYGPESDTLVIATLGQQVMK
jgi:hypothetical protein